MATAAMRYTRKSFFLDEGTLRRAQKALGAATAAETVRTALARAVEMDRFWRFMTRTHGRLPAGSIERLATGVGTADAACRQRGCGGRLSIRSTASAAIG